MSSFFLPASAQSGAAAVTISPSELEAILGESEEDTELDAILDLLVEGGAPPSRQAPPESDDDSPEATVTAEIEALLEESALPLVTLETELLAGWGFRDNVTLSPFQELSSAYLRGGASTFIFTDPLRSWSGHAFAFYERSSFQADIDVDDESIGYASVRGGRQAGPVRLVLGGDYIYVDQFVDVSQDDSLSASQRLQIHQFKALTELEYAWGDDELTTLSGGFQRSEIIESTNDYDEFFASVVQRWNEFDLKLSTHLLNYDQRRARDAEGNDSEHKTALLLWLGFDADWRTNLTDRWALDLGAGFRHTQDLKGTYDTNHRFDGSAALGFQISRQLAINGDLGGRYQVYEARLRDQGDEALWRASWEAGIRLEYASADWLTLGLGYRYSRSFGNEVFDRYDANDINFTATVGF